MAQSDLAVPVAGAYGAMPENEGGHKAPPRRASRVKVLASVTAFVLVACVIGHMSARSNEESSIVDLTYDTYNDGEELLAATQASAVKASSVKKQASAAAAPKASAAAAPKASAAAAPKASAAAAPKASAAAAPKASAAKASAAAPKENPDVHKLKAMIDQHEKHLQGIAQTIVDHSADCESAQALLDTLESEVGAIPEGFEETLAKLKTEEQDLVEAYAHVAGSKIMQTVVHKVDAAVAHCYANPSKPAVSKNADTLTLPDMLKADNLKNLNLDELNKLLSRLDKVHNLIVGHRDSVQSAVDAKEVKTGDAVDIVNDGNTQEAPLKKEDAGAKAKVSADQKALDAAKKKLEAQQKAIALLESQLKKAEKLEKVEDQIATKDKEIFDHDADVKALVEAQISAVTKEVKAHLAK